MIKSSDLRAGNLFEIEGMGNYPLVDFSCDFTGKLHQVTFLSSLVFHRDRVPSETIETIIPELWQIKPIPLTEEWLVKMGFEPATDIDDAPGEGWYRIGIVRHDLQINISTNYNMAHIVEESGNSVLFRHFIGFQCVHQIQNLFFALTGEELTLKEIA